MLMRFDKKCEQYMHSFKTIKCNYPVNHSIYEQPKIIKIHLMREEFLLFLHYLQLLTD